MKAAHLSYTIAILLLVVIGAPSAKCDEQQADWRIQTWFKNIVIDGATPYVQSAIDFLSNSTLWNFGAGVAKRVEDTINKTETFLKANYEEHIVPYTDAAMKRVVGVVQAIPARAKQMLQNLKDKAKEKNEQ